MQRKIGPLKLNMVSQQIMRVIQLALPSDLITVRKLIYVKRKKSEADEPLGVPKLL